MIPFNPGEPSGPSSFSSKLSNVEQAEAGPSRPTRHLKKVYESTYGRYKEAHQVRTASFVDVPEWQYICPEDDVRY